MIVETTDNRLYSVRDAGDPALAHLFIGTEMKRSRGGFVPKKRPVGALPIRETFVSKAHVFRVVEGETAQ